MVRIGIVAEGTSDCLVIEAFIKALRPQADVLILRPDMTLASRSPHGWKGVQSWCIQNGKNLSAIMTGISSRPLDLLVIHADCSMAHNIGASRPCPPAKNTADALRQEIAANWLQLNPLPGILVLATPSITTDTWVAASLLPAYAPACGLECDPRVEEEFVRRRLLRKKKDKNGANVVRKPTAKYRPLVTAMSAALDDVCAKCTEADRFRIDLAAALVPFPV